MISRFFQRRCVNQGQFCTTNHKKILVDPKLVPTGPVYVALFCYFSEKWLFPASFSAQLLFYIVQIAHYTIFVTQIFDFDHENIAKQYILATKYDHNLDFERKKKIGRPSSKFQRAAISEILDFMEKSFGRFIFIQRSMEYQMESKFKGPL